MTHSVKVPVPYPGRSGKKVVAEDRLRKDAYLKGGASTAPNTAEPSTRMMWGRLLEVAS